MLAAMTEIGDPTTFKHTPIRDGQCGGCHTIHGGDDALLLRRDYSDRFYEGFSKEKYDLCFGCHDEEMMERNAVSTPDPKEAVSHIIRLIRQREERKAIHEAYKEERE